MHTDTTSEWMLSSFTHMCTNTHSHINPQKYTHTYTYTERGILIPLPKKAETYS